MYYVTMLVHGATAEINEVHAMVVAMVHTHNSSDHGSADRIAIAFPDYRKGIEAPPEDASYGAEQRAVRLRKGSLGPSIRLFGTRAALEHILVSRHLRSLMENPNVVIGQPACLPPGIKKSCAYIQRKGMTKMTPSRFRRAQQRRAWDRPSEEFPTPLTEDQLESRMAEKQRSARQTTLPNVGVQSFGNGARFSIFIERRENPQWSDSAAPPAGYGFSTAASLCFVPIF